MLGCATRLWALVPTVGRELVRTPWTTTRAINTEFDQQEPASSFLRRRPILGSSFNGTDV